ncbi:hypothetical protein PCASD_19048 [Puccinia coronata f. sp. avenae]|uniref:Uncharacterized protein n=1 Tax=Puccinia coronata f. sp. avenae TaxID=200324 RepID=A0A2N5TWS4_9BASI|nr:hypothetical protein PCASD_19048 [Puccinia coronata f. sp. avenae]
MNSITEFLTPQHASSPLITDLATVKPLRCAGSSVTFSAAQWVTADHPAQSALAQLLDSCTSAEFSSVPLTLANKKFQCSGKKRANADKKRSGSGQLLNDR